MEEVHLDIVGLFPDFLHLTSKAFAFNKNDLQVKNNREDVLKTMKTMAYWVSL